MKKGTLVKCIRSDSNIIKYGEVYSVAYDFKLGENFVLIRTINNNVYSFPIYFFIELVRLRNDVIDYILS